MPDGHRHVALLRGINVGRNKRIGMAPLRAALEARGCTGVRTLLQSGNVVLTAASADPAEVAAVISAAIAEDFGFDVAVVVRSADELAAIVDGNPFADLYGEGDGKLLHVGFCEPAPPPGALDGIDAEALLPERFAVRGSEIYSWYPNGTLDSPMGRALEKARLPVTLTDRNWNTVTKLLELARA